MDPYKVQDTPEYTEWANKRGIFLTNNLNLVLPEEIFAVYNPSALTKGNLVIYTGRAPSGPCHLGHHYLWKIIDKIAKTYGTKILFQIADDEKYIVKGYDWNHIEKYTNDCLLSIRKSFTQKVFVFRNMESIHILYPYILDLVKNYNIQRLKSLFGLKELSYPILYFTPVQASVCVMLASKNYTPCVITGIDQFAHFAYVNKILKKLGYPQMVILFTKFIRGTDGSAKMSTSEHNTIPLNDLTDLKKHIMTTKTGAPNTLEEHKVHGINEAQDILLEYSKILNISNNIENYKKGKIGAKEFKESFYIDSLNYLQNLKQSNIQIRNLKEFN